MAASVASAPSTKLQGAGIDWRFIEQQVWRLQVRIAKAVREQRWGKVRSLQRLLTRSRAGKLWAIRRVTTNKGKSTPGVDGVVWRTSREKLAAIRQLRRRGYRSQPLRRVYIPKKNQRLRPLSIPTMKDRAMQALHLLALSPVAETLADPNSYGFRLRRRVADAWGQCFGTLSRRNSPRWVFEGDIEACFDRIDHAWLLAHTPMDRKVLAEWLRAGYLEKATFHPTQYGTPQGGIISPVLANLALDGLEVAARSAVPDRTSAGRSKVHVIRYADDFVITAATKEMLEERVIPSVKRFLAERGLRLSAEKSRITHVDEGFDFLGAHVRRYGQKLLMKPSREGQARFRRGLRAFVRNQLGISPEKLIAELNRRIRGWTNHYRCLVSSRAFSVLDEDVYRSVWRWLRRCHPSKSTRWIQRKYFRPVEGRQGVFAVRRKRSNSRRALFPESEKELVCLKRASDCSIRRHVKVRGQANPFDPSWNTYFLDRSRIGYGSNVEA